MPKLNVHGQHAEIVIIHRAPRVLPAAGIHPSVQQQTDQSLMASGGIVPSVIFDQIIFQCGADLQVESNYPLYLQEGYQALPIAQAIEQPKDLRITKTGIHQNLPVYYGEFVA